MLKIVLLLVGILVLTSQASGFVFGECKTPPVIKDFDLSKYLGVWYEVERSNVFFEKNLKCVFAKYGAFNSSSISLQNSGLNKKTKELKVNKGHLITIKPEEPNRFQVAFESSSRQAKYNVWATDYKTYTLVYGCSQIVPFMFKLELIWIMSRTPTLSSDAASNLKAKLKEAGVGIKDFEKTDHKDCKYN